MKYHPDRTKGDKASEEKFKEINEAYEILADKEKRAAYDQYGHRAFEQGGGGAGAGGFGNADFGDMFGDIFGDIFGGGGRRGGQQQRRPSRGEDLRYDIEITLEEAAKGTKKEISLDTLAACKDCNGTGAEKDSKVETCPDCHGMGRVRVQQGFFVSEQTCPSCHGTGKKIEKPCHSCHGEGRVHKVETLSVSIPAGVNTGSQLRLHGKGAAGENGAPAGDLYVVIHVKQHPVFQRDGNNLHCEIPVSMTTAALGGSVEAPTLDGKIKIKIPAETQYGKQLRLRGKGIQGSRGPAGDLICHISINTPVNLTEEQKELLKKFDETLADTNQCSKTKGLLDKIKTFLRNIGK